MRICAAEITTSVTTIKHTFPEVLALGVSHAVNCFAESFAIVEKTFHNVASSYSGPPEWRVTHCCNTVSRVF